MWSGGLYGVEDAATGEGSFIPGARASFRKALIVSGVTKKLSIRFARSSGDL